MHSRETFPDGAPVSTDRSTVPSPLARGTSTGFGSPGTDTTVKRIDLNDAREHLGNYVVAELDGTLVGTAGLEVYADVGLVRSVAVAPDRQNQGQGRQVFEVVVDQAHRHGLKALCLLTTTAACHFGRRGFTPDSRHQAPAAPQACAESRGDGPASATFMSLRTPRAE